MNPHNAVLDRFLEPMRQCPTPGLARQLVEFRVDPEVQARVDELASKCNEGLIGPAEQAEYEAIVEEAGLIALLQAKARAFLVSAER
jgi:hypothetical protein